MLESHRRGRKTPRLCASALLAAPLLLVPSAVSMVGHAGASTAGSRTLVSEAAAPSAAGGTLFNVQGAGASFSSSLPPSSVATYVWTPGGQSVQEWLTTPDGKALGQELAQQPATSIDSGPSSSPVDITVDPNSRYQVMTGFGAAMTDSAAYLINTSKSRNAIMNALFGSSGARFNVVRVPMGATDLISSPYQSYDDSVQPDPALSKFSVAHDTVNIIPLLQQARQLQPGLKLLATPWSAPAWMKRGGTFNGDCASEAANELLPWDQGVYAQYFVKFVKAYQRYGLPIDLVSMQNEPEKCDSSYPTMNMTATEEAQFAGDLRAALNQAGLASTGILGFDDNWYNNSGVDPFPGTLVSAAGNGIAAIGYHCYDDGGNLDAFQHHVTYSANLSVLLTECSGFLSDSDTAQNLVSEVREDLLGPIRYSASTSLYWSLAMNGQGGPHIGGCANCRGMVTVNSSAAGDYSLSQDYYYWSQFSKFIDPGAVCIGSTDLGLGSIETVAFRNPDGSIVLVALNSASAESYVGHIVQWEGDTKAQKTAWLVGPDGRRRWISNISTYGCLTANDAPGPDLLSSFELGRMPDFTNVWAVCGVDRIGVNGMLQTNFYARSANGRYTLKLTMSNLVLYPTGSPSDILWQTGVGGDDLILQPDGNLVLYRASTAVWASSTVGAGAAWLIVGNDGRLALCNTAGSYVWTSERPPFRYIGHNFETVS